MKWQNKIKVTVMIMGLSKKSTSIITLILLGNFVMAQNIKSKHISLLKAGIEMHYLEAGDNQNQTFLLVHGLGSNSKAFNKTIPEISKHGKTYAIDLPGFGETKALNSTPSLEKFGEILQEFVKTKKLKNIVLVGHSMGGQIISKLALTKHPKWLKRLVLLSPAGIETFTEKDRNWFKAVITEGLYLNLSDAQIKQNFDVNFYGAKVPKDALFMYEDRLSIKADKEKYKEYCETVVDCIFAMLNEPIYDQLSTIKAPINILFSKNDLLVPNKILHPDLTMQSLVDQLKENHPNINVTLIGESGHFVQWDQTEITNNIILNKTN
ncbi:alpha/beta fold hydrolase [Aegicerativicinus sediminis]|uniref:alpha/beta fold hydrolase n=1 Tax=Aegicerativicinus sediminis TaxID=2893202 RepID=UPI001E29EEBA|nr:alpha/beta hydrolase [Aegicerativicinus sediminis]